MTERVLTQRELNRALLSRQMLLGRESVSVLDAVERLVAMQAQVTSPPYVGLWTRLLDFRREDLTRRMEDREVVRATLLRSTLHLMSARDYRVLRPALQPALDRSMSSVAGRRVAGMDIERMLAVARAFFEVPHTFAELRPLLSELEPERELSAMEYVVRARLPLVQVPGGGPWGYPGNPSYVLAESWLEHAPSEKQDTRALVMRYLAAFGPATVADVQAWCGQTRMKDHIEALRPELSSFRDERGRELFDLPGAPLPDAETPAPTRFIPDYDNLILSHADRTRVLSDEHRSGVFLSAARVRATFLVDGFVRGAWRIEKARDLATLEIEPFEPLCTEDRDDLAEEGERLVRFAAEGAGHHDIRFEAP